MITFYMDENVEGQIVRGLRRLGVNALTVEEAGRTESPDPYVLDRATELGRVVFSRDRDFLREAVRRQRDGEPFAGVVYAHKTQVSIGQCISDLQLLAEVGDPRDFDRALYFLPL